MSAAAPRRFYNNVTVREAEGGHGIDLDGRPLRTPGRLDLIVPSRALAEAMAGEWRDQGGRIDAATMPLTRLANTAIERVAPRMDEVVAEIAAFADADLLCYRAKSPDGLVRLQVEHWTPVLDWVETTHGARFTLAEGVIHVAQDEATIAAIRARFQVFDASRLTAAHIMATLTGSALLALAVIEGAVSPGRAWAAAHVDEDWQISQWGEDAEARSRRELRWREMFSVANFLELLQ